ncbi:MAG: radical SAM family heme chaperone HemW [Gammaproteobacteria bacterium]|nr:radical SAM family heme chaperone HemW [Gammaproteobacteria bacterium]MBT6583514.1 radical SAM family heme chaperone HemW [Gammaproteobacteria bacterium]MBT7879637.1 radical SAM family heme chaperone HemW [Gammaproteobacteria bacterium]
MDNSVIDTPLSLYIHFPWCARKCPYCDFNSHELRGEIPETRYVETLLRDLELEAEPESRTALRSIFMGGGTPSLFSPEAISNLFAGIRDHFDISESEITLEANPGTFDQKHFDGYYKAGVNRLSIGAQSFSADSLARLGRIHGPGEIELAYDGARQAGFNRINIDLMHGLPGQTLEHALFDLKRAIELEPEHISWYQLTIEPNTRYYKYPPVLPKDPVLEEIFIAGNDLLKSAGFAQYEVSAYSLPSEESRHNLNYWQFGDYLGIGAGAHGKTRSANQVIRTTKNKMPTEYLQHPVGKSTIVDPNELKLEFLLNALRLTNGFDLSLFEETTGLSPGLLDSFLEQASAEGFLVQSINQIKPTKKGRLFLNDLLMLVD